VLREKLFANDEGMDDRKDAGAQVVVTFDLLAVGEQLRDLRCPLQHAQNSGTEN
jgi:hypothetical protein